MGFICLHKFRNAINFVGLKNLEFFGSTQRWDAPLEDLSRREIQNKL